MIEIILFILFIIIIKNVKSNSRTTTHHTPPVISKNIPEKPSLSKQEVTKQINKQIYGTENPQERTFVEPTRPYRPSTNSGERYEEWMPVPAGKKVVHCSYCGADNLISEKQAPHQCTCYFCREEL